MSSAEKAGISRDCATRPSLDREELGGAGERAEQVAVGAGQPGLQAERQQSRRTGPRAAGRPDAPPPRPAAGSAPAPRRRLVRRASASSDRHQQRLLLAGRAFGGAQRRVAEGAAEMDHLEVAAMRPHSVAPDAASLDARGLASVGLQPVLGRQRRPFAEPGLDRARRPPGRRAGTGLRLRASAAFSAATASRRDGRDRDAALPAISASSAASQASRSACAAPTSPRSSRDALAHRRVVGRDPRGMAGIEPGHQPVEIAAAGRGGIVEQPVHRRRQPSTDRMSAKSAWRARRRAVDARQAPVAADLRLGQRIAPGAERELFAGRSAASRAPPRPCRRGCPGAAEIDLRQLGAVAGRGRDPGATSPPAGWSCRRRSGRPAPPAAAPGRAPDGGSCGTGSAPGASSRATASSPAQPPAWRRSQSSHPGSWVPARSLPSRHTRIGIST